MRKEFIKTDDIIFIEPLKVLNRTLNNITVQNLKAGGCNTDIVSRELRKRKQRLFKLVD